MTRKPLSDGSRYYASLVMPRKISQGRVLAHNRVRHTVDMPNGRNGFRCWKWWPRASLYLLMGFLS